MAESDKIKQRQEVFEGQSFWAWFWEYFSLEKKYREISLAIRMADKLNKAHNKRFYVLPYHGKFIVRSRHQVELGKKDGTFRRGLTFYEIIRDASYITK